MLLTEKTALWSVGCYHNRGLFSRKLTLQSVRNTIVDADLSYSIREHKYYPFARTPAIKYFMKEHDIGEEISQVLICTDDQRSDFPQYRRLSFSGSTGTVVAGETFTLSVTGITGVVMEVDSASSTAEVAFWSEPTKGPNLSSPDVLTTSGGTLTLDGYVPKVRPRNNMIDVLLQMLCSTGVRGANGKYDTLDDGIGLGIHAD
jgi:hypothetical protein